MMLAPGIKHTHGACRKTLRPSYTIKPQEGVGGLGPKPKKLSDASAKIASPSLKVHNTTSGPEMFGNI